MTRAVEKGVALVVAVFCWAGGCGRATPVDRAKGAAATDASGVIAAHPGDAGGDDARASDHGGSDTALAEDRAAERAPDGAANKTDDRPSATPDAAQSPDLAADTRRVDAGTPGKASSFVGEWEATSGDETTTCAGSSPMTSPLAGRSLTIIEGMDAPLLLVMSDDCQLKMDATATTATLRPGQFCPPVTGPAGETTTTTYDMGVFMVDGMKGTFTTSGKLLVNFLGIPINCTFSSSGAVSKVTM